LIQVNQSAGPNLFPGDFANTARVCGIACAYAAGPCAAKFRGLM
jgi:hypothetical protein